MGRTDKHGEVFKEEAYELLAELETSLLELEDKPDDGELIGRVFRDIHTIKGSGSMFGFDEIAKFTHEIETVFDLVRNGKINVTKDLINLTLAARDQIKSMLDETGGGAATDDAKGAEISSRLKALIPPQADEMEEIVPKLREAFRDEAYELLAELETALLELEESPKDAELIGRVFRALHTIKGSGGACKFNDIESFTHEIETIFDFVRKGRASATKEIVSMALKARDLIKAMFDAYYREGRTPGAEAHEFIESFKKAFTTTGTQSAGSGKDGCEKATYRIRFNPPQDIFKTGANPLLLLKELRELGECRIAAYTEAIPTLEELDPEQCYVSWDITLTTDRGLNAVRDVFIFVEDRSRLTIDVIDQPNSAETDREYKKLGEILIEHGDAERDKVQEVLSSQKRLGEMLMAAKVVNGNEVASALAEQEHVKQVREKHRKEEAASSLRVPAARLDSLVDLVGEMVTVQARLSQIALSINNPNLVSISEEVERLTAQLRDNAMNIRMLPIGMTFSKFRRLVRDMSKELGKEIELVTEGAETELDKTVIERLNDPMVHLIRNSIDHGIEMPDVREAAGKPRQGAVHLSAAHSGAHVLIQVKDDGAGLDADVIRSKAVEKGMIPADSNLPEKELFALILAPGFSTAKKVTSVSGRGVGMDVVKKAIDALRGSIEINSRKGAGTTITLKLPLTLAIIDGFLTKIGRESFIFPLSMVEECVELTRKDVSNMHGRRIANVRGRIVPYIRLREHFMINGTAPDIEQIVIAGADDQRVGFVVDHVVGGHQTVIKGLGKMYRTVEGISGATILGDGSVALLLDVLKLARAAERDETIGNAYLNA